MYEKIDVLYCVEKRDINFLFKKSLQLCFCNFTLLNDIYIVTNDVDGVNALLDTIDIPVEIHVLHEEEILEKRDISGWFFQQMIKLEAHKICKTEYICIIGADALILHPVTEEDLFLKGKQIIYYNRYPFTLNHLEYERKRVANVSTILECNPYKSSLLGDFIMELMIFKASYLLELHEYLTKLYGEDPIYKVIKNMSAENVYQKVCFGEWTLYAVFLLDVLKENVSVRNSNSKFVEQIHTTKDLSLHSSEAKIVHCVCKNIEIKVLEDTLGIEIN